MIAVLQAAETNSKHVTDIYCPGLGTVIGQVSPKEAAEEMASAYSETELEFYVNIEEKYEN